jgi:hypothetical protein
MEIVLLGGCLTVSFGLLARLPLSVTHRIGGAMVLSYISSSLILTVVTTIAAYPWLLLALPVVFAGLGFGGLILWRRYGPKEESPFKPF